MIASSSLNFPCSRPKSNLRGAGARAMEVDRISAMSGAGGQATPAWTKSLNRRRKFVEEIAEDPESEQSEDSTQPPESESESASSPSEEGHTSIDLLA